MNTYAADGPLDPPDCDCIEDCECETDACFMCECHPCLCDVAYESWRDER